MAKVLRLTIKNMTSKEFVKEQAAKCPRCRSTNIHAQGNLQVSGKQAFQEINCYSCGAVYDDIYNLSGYANLLHLKRRKS